MSEEERGQIHLRCCGCVMVRERETGIGNVPWEHLESQS